MLLNQRRVPIFIAWMCFVLQVGFIIHARGTLPDLGIVPEVPSAEELQMLSFGDEELAFRVIAFRMNNMGDTFGRFSSLKDYDLHKVYQWFTLMDGLDNQSNHPAAMAAYYFSQTQKPEDVRYMVDYLVESSKDRPQKRWWWLTQATYIAMHKMKDNDRALEIAKYLEGVEGIPHWAQQMPAFVHEQRGEFEDAYQIMRHMLEKSNDLSQAELNYMRYFMEERAKRLDEVEDLLRKQQMRIDATRHSLE
ncbi:MAG: hypothetical protein EAY65_06540 [Alphaproteobacteria bacterium]|nr:MAG: hypothetical protein EAY65_06540 [Alphaproteobacteria bacterium]